MGAAFLPATEFLLQRPELGQCVGEAEPRAIRAASGMGWGLPGGGGTEPCLAKQEGPELKQVKGHTSRVTSPNQTGYQEARGATAGV